MKKLYLFIGILIGLSILSCNNDDNEQPQLIGSWYLKLTNARGIEFDKRERCPADLMFNNDFSGMFNNVITTAVIECGTNADFTWEQNGNYFSYTILYNQNLVTAEILMLDENSLQYKVVKKNNLDVPEAEQIILKYGR
jgi:hypothetical protein